MSHDMNRDVFTWLLSRSHVRTMWQSRDMYLKWRNSCPDCRPLHAIAVGWERYKKVWVNISLRSTIRIRLVYGHTTSIWGTHEPGLIYFGSKQSEYVLQTNKLNPERVHVWLKAGLYVYSTFGQTKINKSMGQICPLVFKWAVKENKR